MNIKFTVKSDGSLKLLARTFKNKKEIKKLINFDNVTPLAVEEIK